MAWQQSDLDAINFAISGGARVIQFSDRRTEFNSLADLMKTKAIIEAELTGRKRPKRRIGVFFKY
jgi:hypothetical protein